MSLDQSGLRSRLRTGIAWNLVAAASSQGGVFAANLGLANLLGRETFGEYAMLQSTAVTLAAIAQVSTGYTATKYVAEFRSNDPERAGRILGVCSTVAATAGAIAALVLIAGAPWVAEVVLRAPHLARGLAITAVVVFFAGVNGYQLGALAGLEGYQALAIAGAINGGVHLTVSMLGAWTGGLSGALAGLGVSGLVQLVVLRRAVAAVSARQNITVRYSSQSEDLGILWRFALPATLSGLVGTPALWFASAVLVRQPGGFEQLALYVAANNLRTLVLFLPSIINGVGMSVLNNQMGLRDDRRYRRVFWANLGLTGAAVLIGAAGIVLLGPGLLLAFGRGFDQGYPVVVVLMLSTIPEALAVAAYQVVQSRERLWLSLLAVSIPRDGLIVAGAYFLAPLRGAVGVAWAYALGWMLALVLVAAIVRRIGLRIPSTDAQRVAVSVG
jgi:O-antigen/teichoic acid export membrane protein